MAIKDRIKEARQNKHLTQEQLASKIGVAKSTLAGYETGIREPSIETVCKIMYVLNVDANYLWQDEMDFPIQVSYKEMEHIKKYHSLDPHGQQTVDYILDRELERTTQAKEASAQIKALKEQSATTPLAREPEPDYLAVNAAHARTDLDESEITPELAQLEEDIMNDENF